jgi:hypothetical protein
MGMSIQQAEFLPRLPVGFRLWPTPLLAMAMGSRAGRQCHSCCGRTCLSVPPPLRASAD